MSIGRIVTWILSATLLILPLINCSGSPSDSPVLTADVPLHLEDHLEAAVLVGSDVPEDVPQPVVWSFDEAQPDWKLLPLGELPFEPMQLAQTDDALRVTLGNSTEEDTEFSVGAFYVDVPDWTPDDWAHVQVRARTSSKVRMIGMAFNLPEPAEEGEEEPPFRFGGEQARVIQDGSVQTYSLRADWSGGQWEGSWRQLILYAVAPELSASIDILSVTVIPKESGYAGEDVGVRSEVQNRVYRRLLYTHAPGSLEYRVQVPEAGRLDFGLGVLRTDFPVTFRVTARPDG